MISWTRLHVFLFSIFFLSLSLRFGLALAGAYFVGVVDFCLFRKHTWLYSPKPLFSPHTYAIHAFGYTIRDVKTPAFMVLLCLVSCAGLLHHIDNPRLHKIEGKMQWNAFMCSSATAKLLLCSFNLAGGSFQCIHTVLFVCVCAPFSSSFPNVYLAVISLLYWPLNVI